MRPKAATSKARKHVLPVYREIDAHLAAGLQQFTGEISCKRGCSSCCGQLVVITSGEAEVMAEAIVSPALRKNAHAILAKLDLQAAKLEAWALAFGGDSVEALRKAWWQSHETCALLDEATQTCGAYSDRPSPCRTYHVVSDPLLCGVRGADGESIDTLQLQVSEEANQYILMRLATASHQAGLEVLVGSLPQLLAMALRRKLGLAPTSSTPVVHVG